MQTLKLGWLLVTIFALLSTIDARPPNLNKREKPRLASQRNAFYHLGSISQKGKKKLEDMGPVWTYEYDPSAGEGAVVYVIDTGVDPNNEHIKTMRHYSTSRWLIPNAWPSKRNGDKNDPDDHGTCVVSLVASETFGVAKNVELVFVKITALDVGDKKGYKESGKYAQNLIEALELVKSDIIAHDLKGRAIINMSFGVHREVMEIFGKKAEKKIKQLMQDLTALAPIFASGGNVDYLHEGNNFDLTKYPQLWHEELPGMILVGMADIHGRKPITAKMAPEGSLWAIGSQARCASASSRGEAWKIGSSFASPQAAGLAAYIMGLPRNHLPDPRSNFGDFVEKLFTILRSSSRIRPGARDRETFADLKTPAVPLISNRLVLCEEPETGCGCVIL